MMEAPAMPLGENRHHDRVNPSATTHGTPSEDSANPATDALPPFLETTIRNLTTSALASSHIEGDYPDPVAVRATIEQLTLESALRDLDRLKELTADHGLNERQAKVVALLVGGWAVVVTTESYSRIERCSRRTAARDIKRLVELGILVRNRRTDRSITYRARRPL